MPGTDKRTSAKELREELRQAFPGARLISRKASNTEAIAYYPEDGRVIGRAGSNFRLEKKLTDPDFTPDCLKSQNRLLDVPPTLDLKKRAENLAINVIGYLNELREMTKKKPIVKYDENGFIKKIKAGDFEYTQK